MNKTTNFLRYFIFFLSPFSTLLYANESFENFPVAESEETISTPLISESFSPDKLKEILEGKSVDSIWLHTKVKRTCYYLYDKHEHQTWVTKGKNGPKYKVNKLTLRSWVGGGDSDNQSCKNCSSKSRLIEEYNLMCRSSCSAGAIGSFNGRRACVN